MAGFSQSLFLSDEKATAQLGADLAMAMKPGDTLALDGDLGAGKTSLARSLIRALAGDPSLEVPSPSFTLVQLYELPSRVAHFDLYRLGSADEMDELGFDELRETGIVVVEWPENAGDRIPADAIHIGLTHEREGRRAVVTAEGSSAMRLERSFAARQFLSDNGWGDAQRRFLTGDASSRAYETLHLGGQTRILMNAPRMPDGPPIMNGLPYSRIAHLAEDVTPFVAIAAVLRDKGFAAPEIHAQDLENGFLIIEHLGSKSFLDDRGQPVRSRYATAAQLLAAIHTTDWLKEISLGEDVSHQVPDYDRHALHIEIDLLPSWYFEFATGGKPAEAERRIFRQAWDEVLDHLETAETSLVLRDYHSPNIVWRDGRNGNDRVGLIDFQDAVMGPSAYDVASLAQDARVDISPEMERATIEAYCQARASQGSFDRVAFERAYAIMAAQRNTKILGIFVRLDKRDGKPAYLAHLPRIRSYLSRVLGHEALAPLRDVYAKIGIEAEKPS